MSGALGTAEDPSEVAIACRQIGPIVFKEPIKEGERVFDEGRSLIFESLQVVRFFDTKRNVLVYVAYSPISDMPIPSHRTQVASAKGVKRTRPRDAAQQRKSELRANEVRDALISRSPNHPGISRGSLAPEPPTAGFA